MQSYYVDNSFPSKQRFWLGKDAFLCDGIVWKRPSAITTEQPEFIIHGATRCDLDQGDLGNCWFIAAAAALATQHPDQFKKVVDLDQTFKSPRYTGQFRFSFYRNGTWVTVIIDDFLPTEGNKLKYCRNVESPNEFWPCLLEKAYAKFRGDYSALDGGHIINALVDLTGGNPLTINLRGQTNGSRQLFDALYQYNQRKAVMGAWFKLSDNRNGLISGHAYSITGFHVIQAYGREVNLIRVRNPWGCHEWQGAWSDNSEEMNGLPRILQRTLRFHKQDDGEFWMDFNDFIAVFDEIDICQL